MHSNANHCPYSDAGTQTAVSLFIDGCLPKRLVLHCEPQPACWPGSEENLKRPAWGMKAENERRENVQTYHKEKLRKWTRFEDWTGQQLHI